MLCPERPVEGAGSAKRKRTDRINLSHQSSYSRRGPRGKQRGGRYVAPRAPCGRRGLSETDADRSHRPSHQSSRLRERLCGRAWANFLGRGGSQQEGQEKQEDPWNIKPEETQKP